MKIEVDQWVAAAYFSAVNKHSVWDRPNHIPNTVTAD